MPIDNQVTRPSAGVRQTRRRSGAASVEFAVCLPMIAALVFGVIEASNAVFLQQALTASAYEAGNVVSAIGGTSASGIVRANTVLAGLGIKSATIAVAPPVDANTPVGTTIVITCSAKLSGNSVTSWCLSGRTFTATYTVPRL